MRIPVRHAIGLGVIVALLTIAVWARPRTEIRPSKPGTGSEAQVDGERPAEPVPPVAPTEPSAPSSTVPRPGLERASEAPAPEGPAPIRIRLGKADLSDPRIRVGEFWVSPEDAVVQKGNAFGYNAASYGATLTESEIQVAGAGEVQEIGRPLLTYTLEDIRVGGEVLVRGGPAEPKLAPEDRRIAYDRGAVEERYLLRKDGLEQTFILHQIPPRRGDIRVSGHVRTNAVPPPEGTKAESLSFTHDGREVLTVSHAVAKDAAGRSLALELAYAGGRIVMTVPSDWVQAAKLPIEIDPLIGSPVTVDSTVGQGAGLFERGISVAYNSVRNEWFVAWVEPLGASTFNHDVWGQRVSAAGALVGSPLPIHWSTVCEYEVAVSHAPSVDRYLVLCRIDATDNGNLGDGWIIGGLVKGDNSALEGGTFNVSAYAGSAKASAAFDGTRWLTAFDYGSNISVRFLTTAVPPVATAETIIEWSPARDGYLTYDPTSSRYGLVWIKTGSGQPVIAGVVLNTAGTVVQGVTNIETTGGPTSPSIAAGSGNFLVAWTQTSPFGAFARVLNTSLSPLTAKLTLATGTAEAKYARSRYSSVTGRWVAVYTDPLGQTNIHSNQVTPTGTVQAMEAVTTTAGLLETIPELAWNATSNEMLIAYRSGNAAPYSIRAVRWALGPPPSTTVTVTATDASAAEEGPDPGTFTFTRTGSTAAALSVYFTVGGTATPGTDYAALTSPVTIPIGAASATRVVTPVNDSAVEIAETVVVSITIRPDYAIGGSGTATVTITNTDPPLPPTRVRTIGYNNTIDVEWDPSPSPFIAGYNVFRKTGTTGTWAKLNTTGIVLITKYRDSTAVNGTTYFYRVTAVRQ